MLFPYYDEQYRNLRTVFLGAEAGQVTGEVADVGIDTLHARAAKSHRKLFSSRFFPFPGKYGMINYDKLESGQHRTMP